MCLCACLYVYCTHASARAHTHTQTFTHTNIWWVFDHILQYSQCILRRTRPSWRASATSPHPWSHLWGFTRIQSIHWASQHGQFTSRQSSSGCLPWALCGSMLTRPRTPRGRASRGACSRCTPGTSDSWHKLAFFVRAMFLHTCACICVEICVCVCMYVYIYIYIYIYTHTHIHTHILTNTHILAGSELKWRIHAHIHAHNSYMHLNLQQNSCTTVRHKLWYSVKTYIHTYIHIHIFAAG